MKVSTSLFLLMLMLFPVVYAGSSQRTLSKLSCVEKNGDIIANFHAYSVPGKLIVKDPKGGIHSLSKGGYAKFVKKRDNYILIKINNARNKFIFKNSGLYHLTFSDPVRVSYEQPNVLRCDVFIRP